MEIERRIKTFTLHRGRMGGQRRDALTRLSALYGVGAEDLAANFASSQPLVIEIGCGSGEATVALAQANPQIHFMAIEVYLPGITSLLKTIERQAISNLKVLVGDAVTTLEQRVKDGSLYGANIFFPDPWPKTRHHKRRLLQASFVATLAAKVSPQGFVHCATDWHDYALQIEEVFAAQATLWQPLPASPLGQRPSTKFERRGLKLGHEVKDLIYQRLPNPASPSSSPDSSGARPA